MNLYEELKPIAKENNAIIIGKKVAKYVSKIRKGLIENSKKGELNLYLKLPNDVTLIEKIDLEIQKDGFDLITLGVDKYPSMIHPQGLVRAYVSPIVNLEDLKKDVKFKKEFKTTK